MFATRPQPQYQTGTPVRVVQRVRVGHRLWQSSVMGVVEGEGVRPIGGMEMGGKSLYCHQPTLRLRLPDGEITTVALDDDSRVEIIDTNATAAP